jgi:hypothetical protein
MHSKYQLWDFLNTFKKETPKKMEGLFALKTFDHVCLKIIKDFLLQDLDDKRVIYKMAGEVKKDWIEEEFKSLSLFSESENFFIHQANDLTTELIDIFSSIQLTDRFIILSFENELASWKKVIKDEKIQAITIELPKFWEMNKLLDFCCHYLKLRLSHDSKTWIIEVLENNLPTFYNACFLLKLNHPDPHELGLGEVQKLLVSEKVDHFVMASLFSKKKKKEFYRKISLFQNDFDKMRSLFLFMQSHLLKVADPSYLSLKSKLTNYDKEIQTTSKLWAMEDLLSEIARFNKLEILSKKKDSNLWHELKLEYFRCS